MKNGVCPKCSGVKVREVPGDRTGVTIPNRKVFSSGVFVKLYFCGTCGYTEFYVEDENDLPDLAAAWPKVPVATVAEEKN